MPVILDLLIFFTYGLYIFAGGHEEKGMAWTGHVLTPVSFASFPKLFSNLFSLASASDGTWLMGCGKNVALQEQKNQP